MNRFIQEDGFCFLMEIYVLPQYLGSSVKHRTQQRHLAFLTKGLTVIIYCSSRNKGFPLTHTHAQKCLHIPTVLSVTTSSGGAVSGKDANLLSQAPNKSQTVGRLGGKQRERQGAGRGGSGWKMKGTKNCQPSGTQKPQCLHCCTDQEKVCGLGRCLDTCCSHFSRI